MWSGNELAIWITVLSIATAAVPATVGAETNVTATMATSPDPVMTQQSTALPVSAATNSTPGNSTSAAIASTTASATAGWTTKTAPPPAGVPGWGIALLVLAALVLLLLILLLVGLLSWCCCCSKGRHERPDDVPLYTTHSRFWHSNSGAYEDVDKPAKMAAM